MYKLVKIWAAVFVLMLLASAALADDMFPPNWRAEPGSQYWVWDTWGGFPGPMPADTGGSVPLPGVPDVQPPVATPGMNAAEWWPEWYLRESVVEVHIDDDLIFHLDNYDTVNEEKWVRVQITYWGEPGSPSSFNVWTDQGGPVPFPAAEAESYYHADGWVTKAYDFILEPNPDWENIGLKFDHYPEYVDQVVIDTWCVPEPTTVALVLLGGLALLRRKRST